MEPIPFVDPEDESDDNDYVHMHGHWGRLDLFHERPDRRLSMVTKMTMHRKITTIFSFLALWQYGSSLPRPPDRTVTAAITFAIFLVPGVAGLAIAVMRAVF